MDSLLINSLTRKQLEAALKSDSHAIGFAGPKGSGKALLADEMAKIWLKTNNPEHNVYKIIPDNNSIGVDQTRALKQFLKLKTAGTEKVRRVVIVNDSETMTVEAQNALLKVLEEPPTDTKFILCANRLHQLRDTIRSRIQVIDIRPCSLEDTLTHFVSLGFTEDDIKKAYIVSEGYAVTCSLILDSQSNEVSEALSEAKGILKLNTYEKLLLVESLVKDKERTVALLAGIRRVLSAAMYQESKRGNNKSLDSLLNKLDLTHKTEENIRKNGNLKLLLTNLLLNL